MSGSGSSGVLNQSAGTLSATTLAIKAGGSVTQSGSGVINASATTLASGASLTLANQGSGTIDGAAAGQGTLTLAGNYTSNAVIGGSARLAAINVNDGVTLNLGHNAAATTITVGQGSGGTLNLSAGTLTATTLAIKNGGVFSQSGSSNITASTTIYDGGTFNVNSALNHTGALTLGSGSSGVLNLNNNVVTVSSSFTMAAGSTLKTTIYGDSNNAAGRIIASGPVSIAANTTVDIKVQPATLSTGRTYVVVSGGVGSTIVVPTSIISSDPNYEFDASSDGSSLTLTTRSVASYVKSAQSANTRAIAGALQTARTSGSADMATVLTQLNSLSGSTAKDAAMASMAPIMENALTLANREALSQIFGTIDTRLESLRGHDVASPSGFSSGNPVDGVGVWLQIFGNDGTQNAREGAAGFKTRTQGISFSVDTALPDNRWTLGTSLAHAASNIGLKDARSGSGSDISSYQISLYGAYEGNGHFVNAIANIGTNMYISNRQVSVGAITRMARGEYKGMQYSAKTTIGFPFQRDSMEVTPLISLEYTHLNLDAYTETGAGALNLNVDAQKYDFLQLGFGASVRFAGWLGNGRLVPTVRAMWLHDALADRQTLTSSFTGGGGDRFATSAPNAARNSLKLGLSMSYKVGNNTTWALSYDALLKDGFLGHAGMLTYHYQF